MTTYAVFFRLDDGLPLNGRFFKDAEIPPEEVWPPDATLVSFDETHQDFELLYAMFVEDPNREYLDYDPFETTYNSKTNTFSFVKKDIPSGLDIVRNERDAKLAATDNIVYAPDMPDDIKTALLSYRQTLRDITDGLADDVDPTSITWPELPSAFMLAPIIED